MAGIIVSIYILTIFIGSFSGVLLKYSDSSLEKYQNKHLRKVVHLTNTISSTVILLPLQLLLNIIIILAFLCLFFFLSSFIAIDEQLRVYFSFTTWLVIIQFVPKQVFDLSRMIINKQIIQMQIHKGTSDFINYIFHGKIFIYVIAAGFVIFNMIISVSNNNCISNENLQILLSIINSSVITFLAIDRIIEGITKWKKT